MELVARPTRDTEFSSHDLKPPSPEDDQPPSLRQATTVAGVAIPTAQQLSIISSVLSKPSARNLRALRRPSRLVIGPVADEFRRLKFPEAAEAEWNDWQWQVRHRITSLFALEKFIELSTEERAALTEESGKLPMAITPYYLSLIDRHQPGQAIRRCMVPTAAEAIRSKGEADDPLGEDSHEVAPGLVHRYPDRVLLLVTDFCSAYCRYCTRSRLVAGHGTDCSFRRDRLEKALTYIHHHPEVRDVLISGGDPLTLADEDLDWILKRLRRIKHVEIVRIGTKAPVVLPQRITANLCTVLKRYHPLFISIHFTHPAELTPEVGQACGRLADAGIPLGSQTVLLKGINDNVATMKQLVQGLLKIRVRPYYLYQCDPITGSAHFRTPVTTGLEMIAGLRGHTTGYAVPTYVIDAPGGGGKIALYPESVVDCQADKLVLRNYAGRQYIYPEVEALGS